MKRALDVLFACVILFVTLPLMLLVAVGIRVSSPGPILFRARRVGLNGHDFSMLKFRSMHAGRSGPAITAGADPRVFRFGQVIRKLKLDELPQFINVLKGEMSIVGPRPEDPDIVESHYTGWMKETLRVRPGITSPGSIFYYMCGEALVDADRPEQSYVERLLPPKLAIERAYLDRATVVSDVWIVLRTVTAVFSRALGIAGRPSEREIAEALTWVAPDYFVGLR